MIMMKQKRTSPGPDGLPYWLWKDYAHYLAPVLTNVLNLNFLTRSLCSVAVETYKH